MIGTEGVTVCVPTHPGRERLTEELLRSLEPAREAAGVPVEAIVVADPDGGGAPRRRGGFAAEVMRGPSSAGAKRNLAAERARHELLLFVDSDCLATDMLIARHLEALGPAPTDVAGIAGATVMHGEGEGIWDALEHSRLYNACFDFTELYREVGWAVTSNLLVRRAALRRVGGFATDTYTRFGGEDVDLGIRMRRAGLRWLTEPRATVLHQRSPVSSLGQAAHKLFTYGRADVFLTERHSSHRVPNPNPFALGALAAALVFTRSRRPLPTLAAGLAPGLASVLVQATRRAQEETVYGPTLRAGRATARGPRGIRDRLAGAVVDAAFDAGVAFEAARRGRPGLAFCHFAYADEADFVRRQGAAA